MTVKQARERLAIAWFCAGGFIFLIMLGQTFIGNKFNGVETEAWGWLSPHIAPTLSLMIGVLIRTRSAGASNDLADRFLFWLALAISAFYLAVIFIVLLSHNFQPRDPEDTLRVLRASNLYLVPFQGLAVGALGAFFARQS